jgi:hypothetical protein
MLCSQSIILPIKSPSALYGHLYAIKGYLCLPFK